jgi:hypothetical protein
MKEPGIDHLRLSEIGEVKKLRLKQQPPRSSNLSTGSSSIRRLLAAKEMKDSPRSSAEDIAMDPSPSPATRVYGPQSGPQPIRALPPLVVSRPLPGLPLPKSDSENNITSLIIQCSTLVRTSRVSADFPQPELVLRSPSHHSKMKVVSTFHHPSAATCSAKCKFVPNDREYLVIGKTNRLELYSLQPKGLHLESSLDVWGHVVAVWPVEFSVSAVYGVSGRTLRSTLTFESRIGPDRDKLTDHPFPKLILLSCVVSKDGTPTLQEDDWKSLHEVGAQVSEELTDVVVNGDTSVVVAICCARRLRIYKFGESHDVMFVISPASCYVFIRLTRSAFPQNHVTQVTFRRVYQRVKTRRHCLACHSLYKPRESSSSHVERPEYHNVRIVTFTIGSRTYNPSPCDHVS